MHLILVGAPRSGASVLQAALLEEPSWGASDLSRRDVFELATPSAASDGFASQRLTSVDATVSVVDAIRRAASSRVEADVLVDWYPRLSMGLSLLAAALPDARFVVMARRPVPTISSLIDAWRSRRFASIPDLPEWWGEPWAFPLVEDWRRLIGAPLAKVCAEQWAGIASAVLDDLEALPAERWAVASYEGLLADPIGEITTVTAALGLPWAGALTQPMPVTSTAVTPPIAWKWQRNWGELSVEMADVEPTVDRYRGVLLSVRPDLPWPELEAAPAQGEPPRIIASAGTPFSSSHTASLPQVLGQAKASLVITTYKSGHVILARNNDGSIDTEFTDFDRPMGLAVTGSRLAIGAADTIRVYTANPGIESRVLSPRPVDGAYAPRSIVFTGDVAIHDMAYAADGSLYFVNTRFSCVCRQDLDYSFVPVWRPSWISGLAAEDRCHLNGLCVVDGIPRYVTALSQTDSMDGWRAQKGTSGVVVDMTTDAVVASGLSMPHSPRWHDGHLWVLESGRGTLATVDVDSGAVTTVATLPGFTRGLAFLGPYALVGLSQVRESVFASLPVTEQRTERNCGIWMVDTRNGDVVGFLRFDGQVQEIFDVAVLPASWPSIVEAGAITQSAFVLPDEALIDIVAPSQSS